ncbi:Hypothetical protein, putative [Bodo saltans]|uniref:Membrane transport protein MMPL domain-containing protein n=1 Tax=Bodo saltans TaxID=75058 RepID=A0A0S4JQG4_BODSA|nr:Hypothetical protein, putative [Bodo saltans]|eukprot:CUG91286.1 Hypothetical protein, putative [Bodo saltans]
MHAHDFTQSLMSIVGRQRASVRDNDPSNPIKPSTFVNVLAALVSKGSYVIIVVWIAFAIGCVFPAMEVNDYVTQDTSPPAGTQAADATNFFRQYFPDQIKGTGFVLFSRALNDSLDLASDPRYNSFDLALEIFSKNGTYDFNYTHLPNATASGTTQTAAYSSYRAVLKANLPVPVALSFLAPDNRSALMTIAFGNSYTAKNTTEFNANMQNAITFFTNTFNLTGQVRTTIFGYPTFLAAITASSTSDTETMIFIVVPLAFLVFAAALASGRFLIMPLLTIVVAYAISFAILDGVAQAMPLNTMAPSICVFLLISYVLTYSFYFMSQYRKQLKENRVEACDPELALSELYTTAGRSVFLSCVTVCLSGVGLTIFQASLIRSTGIAIIVVILVTMAVTLTLIPALIASFPVFFSGAIDVWVDAYNPEVLAKQRDRRQSTTEEMKGENTPVRPRPDTAYEEAEAARAQHEKIHRSIVTFIGGSPQRYPILLLGLALCFIPASFAFNGVNSNDLEQFMPKSQLLDEWTQLQKVFRAGEVFPYQLFVQARTDDLDAHYFHTTQELIYTLCELLPWTSPRDFDGISIDGTQSGYLANGGNASVDALFPCFFAPTDPQCLYTLLMTYGVYKSGTASYFTFKARFDPLSSQGTEWYRQAKALLPIIGPKFNYTLYLYGYGADSYDSVEYSQGVVSKSAGITVAVVFLAIMVAFGSLVLPLLVCLSTFLAVASAFGIANLLYGHNVLSFLKVDSLAGEEHSIAWQVPILCLVICVGIVLNFEVIVLVKVFGKRWRGVDSNEAVLEGVIGVGREVSVSALMSLIAFGGLLANSIPAINQVGAFFFVSTLVQAFVLRPLVTLPLMTILGEKNWWPLQLLKDHMCAPIGVEEDAEERPTMIDRVDYRRSLRRSHFRNSIAAGEPEAETMTTPQPEKHTRSAQSVRFSVSKQGEGESIASQGNGYGTV